MISLTSGVVGELLSWAGEMAPAGTEFSRCFEEVKRVMKG